LNPHYNNNNNFIVIKHMSVTNTNKQTIVCMKKKGQT